MIAATDVHDTTGDAPAPAALLVRFARLFTPELPGPVLDLACGEGANGLYLAARGLRVVLIDRAADRLDVARARAGLAGPAGLTAEFRQLDLERPGENPLPERVCGGVLVFRYLHRPLLPCIDKALAPGGLLVYETYLAAQAAIGRPKNPAFLLEPGELARAFAGYEIIHTYEGELPRPRRIVAQLVARKPST